MLSLLRPSSLAICAPRRGDQMGKFGVLAVKEGEDPRRLCLDGGHPYAQGAGFQEQTVVQEVHAAAAAERRHVKLRLLITACFRVVWGWGGSVWNPARKAKGMVVDGVEQLCLIIIIVAHFLWNLWRLYCSITV